MKTYFLLLAFALTSLVAEAQVQKSLIKSFNLSGANMVVLDLKGAVELRTSDNSALRLQTDIELKNANVNLFDIFLTRKRYDMQTEIKNNAFYLVAPERKPVRLGSGDLQEVVRYIVYLPEGVTAKMIDSNEAQTATQVVPTATLAIK